VVQVDEMGGAGWQTRYGGDISYSGTFQPADIDFDSRGYTYIINDTPQSAGYYIVIRIDDITASSFTPIIDGNGTGMRGIAIDRNNNIMYYGFSNTGNTIHYLGKVNFDTDCSSFPCTPTALDYTNLTSIEGLAVDDTGMLYIACRLSGTYSVVKYDPSGGGSVISSYPVGTGAPWDVMYRAPYVYVANLAGAVDNQIIQLDTGMNRIDGLGTYYTSTGPGAGDFWGARRFLALRPSGFIVADDGTDGMTNADRLVSFDDISGANWDAYGSEGTGTDQFGLLYVC
jgi:hypothetical protein